MYDELSIEQPIPDHLDGGSDAEAGGCNAGAALGVIFIITILVVLFVAIIKQK